MMDMARLTSCLSRPHLNLPTSSNTSIISLTSKQGKSTQSYLGLLAAISPLVRSVLPPCSCHHPHDHDILLPQIDETVVSLLLQFVAEGLVTATLRNCTQVLETLQVLRADTGSVMLEKKKQEIIKEETCVEDNDSNFDTGEGDEEDEIGIVYEGQSSNVTRLERVSFVTMKTEAEDACSRTSRQQQRKTVTPLLSPTPPVTSSCSLTYFSAQRYNFQDLKVNGLTYRTLEREVEWLFDKYGKINDASYPKTDIQESPEDMHLLDLYTRRTLGMLMMVLTGECLMGRSSGLTGTGGELPEAETSRVQGKVVSVVIGEEKEVDPPRISRSRGEDRGGGRHIEKVRSRRRTLDRSVSRGEFKDESESNEAREDRSKKYV